MSAPEFFCLLAAIYLAPQLSSKVGIGSGIACMVLAAIALGRA